MTCSHLQKTQMKISRVMNSRTIISSMTLFPLMKLVLIMTPNLVLCVRWNIREESSKPDGSKTSLSSVKVNRNSGHHYSAANTETIAEPNQTQMWRITHKPLFPH